VAYRLPLAYEQRVVWRKQFALPPGKTYTDELPLADAATDGRYRAGTALLTAQIDFQQGDEAGRLYISTHGAVPSEDPTNPNGPGPGGSYPHDGFSVLGPIPRAEIDLDNLPEPWKDASVEQWIAKGWTLASGETLHLRAIDLQIALPLGAEVIPVRGQWDAGQLKPCVYLLAGTVTSPLARAVRLKYVPSSLPGVWLNGSRVSQTAKLTAGDNRLLLAYEPPVSQRYSAEHAGPALRIVDAETGQRLQDIQYRPVGDDAGD
jgi:hypothetical protein